MAPLTPPQPIPPFFFNQGHHQVRGERLMMAQTVATVKVALHIRSPERVVFQPQHGNQMQRPKFNLLCRHLPYCQAPFLHFWR